MGKYVIHNGNLYSADELYHYGVKGMIHIAKDDSMFSHDKTRMIKELSQD